MQNPTINILAIVILVMIVCPFFVYFCVKFGTFAFYKAKQLANQNNNHSQGESNE